MLKLKNYSFLADKVGLEEEADKYKDYKFAKWMSKNKKIQGIPPSAFYSEEHKNLGEDYIRYCFIKVIKVFCAIFIRLYVCFLIFKF